MRTTRLICILLMALGAQPVRAAVSSPVRVPHAAVRCPARDPASGSVTVSVTETSAVPSLFRSFTVQSMFGVDAQGRTFPEVALEVPTVRNGGIRNGGRTYVVHLKPGLRWSDGTRVTSRGAAFGWRVAYDAATGPACEPNCVIARVDTPDQYTVVYHLTRVDHTFLLGDIPDPLPSRWRDPWTGDSHAAAVALQSPDAYTGPNWPSDGPYGVVRTQDSGAKIEMTPMKYYDVMNCGAFIKHLTLDIDSASSGRAALEAGKVALLSVGFLSGRPLRFHDPRHRYRTHVDPSGSLEQLLFNVDPAYDSRPNPLHDARVRQALALALDKHELIANALGLSARQTDNVIQWTFCVRSPKYASRCADRSIDGQWDPIAHRYNADPGRGVALLDAKRLLHSTRWRDGFSLQFAGSSNVPFRQAEEDSLARSWARLGVHVIDNQYAAPALFGTYDRGGILARGEFQVSLIALDEAGMGIDNYTRVALTTPFIARRAQTRSWDQLNYGGIDDPAIDRAVTRANDTFDGAVRRREYNRVQEIVNQQAYVDVLYGQAYSYVEDRRIAHLSDSLGHPDARYVFWNVWGWQLGRRTQ